MSTIKYRQHFSAAHFYHQPAWSADRNQTEFGKCFTEYGHGHDYVCEIEFSNDDGSAEKAFRQVVESLDHQHLNFVIPEFKTLIPTTENLALYIQRQILLTLQKKKAESQLVSLRLFETPDIWVELS